MERVEILEKLTSIFQEIFDDEDIVLEEGSTSADIDGWDSLMHINIIAEIEDVFNIQFPMESVMKMKTVGEMIDYIITLQ